MKERRKSARRIRADTDETVDAEVWPEGSLEVLSQTESDQLRNEGEGETYQLLRRCILAVLNSGGNTDDARAVLTKTAHFPVNSYFLPEFRGQPRSPCKGFGSGWADHDSRPTK